MWEVFFEQLFRKKFGKYAGNILAAFLWARIHKRTQELGYMEGGFQTFIDHAEETLKEIGVDIRKGTDVPAIMRKGEQFTILGKEYDSVISTLPTPILTKVAQQTLPHGYLEQLKKLKYLHALVLILETEKPILDETYWLNICTEDIPLMFVGQHTNFVDPMHYGGRHLAYIGYYLERDDFRMNMTTEEFAAYVLPHIKTITQKNPVVHASYSFKGPFAQPIFDQDFLKNKPDFITPTKNFFIANLDMTYPYDRGTNYAVKLGKQVAALI
jgi:protoporphyrinogen oxidase